MCVTVVTWLSFSKRFGIFQCVSFISSVFGAPMWKRSTEGFCALYCAWILLCGSHACKHVQFSFCLCSSKSSLFNCFAHQRRQVKNRGNRTKVNIKERVNSSTNEWFHINFHHLSSHSLRYFVSFAIPHTVLYWIKKPYSFARPRVHYLLVVFFFFFSRLSHRIILTLIHHLEYFIPSFSCYPSFFFTLSFSFFSSIFCGWMCFFSSFDAVEYVCVRAIYA